MRRGEGIVKATMKRSAVDGMARLAFGDVKRGMFVVGRVTRVEPYGLFVQLDNSEQLVGLVHGRNISDAERLSHDELRARFAIGTTLRLLVFRVDAARRFEFVRLSNVGEHRVSYTQKKTKKTNTYTHIHTDANKIKVSVPPHETQ